MDRNHAELSRKIDSNHAELSKRIDDNYKELNGKIDSNHKELSEKIDSNRKEISELSKVVTSIGSKLNALLWVFGGLGTLITIVVTVGKALRWF